MRLRLAALLAAALAGIVALAGCGGSDSTTGTTSETLTKSEFVAKANAICAKGNQEIRTAGKKLFSSGQAPSPAAQEKFVTATVIPSIQQQIDGVDALPAPAGDEQKVQAIVDAAHSALDKVKQNPSLITQQGQSDPFAQADKLTNSYGLTQCG
jgi:hypothetical protein